MLRTLSLSLCAALACAGSVLGQQTQVQPRTQPGQAGQAPPAATRTLPGQRSEAGRPAQLNDSLWAAAAASSGLKEVAVSQLAADRSESNDIKEFARRMIEDHTKANRELATLASSKRMAVPAALEISAQACVDILSGVRGQEFDACYAHSQLVDHQAAVAMFEAAAERARDPEIKQFASRNLETIRGHLKHAQMLAEKFPKDSDSSSRGTNRDRDRDREKGESQKKDSDRDR